MISLQWPTYSCLLNLILKLYLFPRYATQTLLFLRAIHISYKNDMEFRSYRFLLDLADYKYLVALTIQLSALLLTDRPLCVQWVTEIRIEERRIIYSSGRSLMQPLCPCIFTGILFQSCCAQFTSSYIYLRSRLKQGNIFISTFYNRKATPIMQNVSLFY